MVKPITRTKITIIDPENGLESKTIGADNLTINLVQLEQRINARRNERLSWSHLYSALVQSTTVDGEAVSKRQFYSAMLDAFRQITGDRDLTYDSIKLNADYPVPSAGFAQAICNYFDLNNASPRLADLLVSSEVQSIEFGKSQKNKSEQEATVGNMSNCSDSPTVPTPEDSSIAIRSAGSPEQRLLANNTVTICPSGTEKHHLAHAAAREIQPGTNLWADGGQFTSVMALAAAARRDKGWSERAAAEAKTSQGASLDH